MALKTFILIFSIAFSNERGYHDLSYDNYIERNYRKAGTTITRELWKRSDLNKDMKIYSKRLYKNTFTREERKVIGICFPVIQMLIDKEINYEWEF